MAGVGGDSKRPFNHANACREWMLVRLGAKEFGWALLSEIEKSSLILFSDAMRRDQCMRS